MGKDKRKELSWEDKIKKKKNIVKKKKQYKKPKYKSYNEE